MMDWNRAVEASRQKMFVVWCHKNIFKVSMTWFSSVHVGEREPSGSLCCFSKCLGCVKCFRNGFYMLMKEVLWWSCWSFQCSCYSLRDIFYSVITFSSFCSKQFVFRISPCCCLKKTAGASIWWISLLDGKFDDPSSSLKICEEILKVSNLTVALTGIFCP